MLTALFDEVEDERITPDFVAEVSEEITKIVASHSQVDWTNNKTIHDRISQDIDDLFYKYEKEHGLKLSFDLIDKIIDNGQDCCPAEVLSDGHHLPTNHNRRWVRNPIQS